MTDGLINEQDLMEKTGIGRKSALLKWLDDNHVPYLPAKNGGIVTTLQALTLAAQQNQGQPVGSGSPPSIDF